MKKIITAVYLLLCVTSFGQINFKNLSLSEALSKAQSESKMIFLQLEAPDCRQCTEVANKAFEDKDLSKTVNESFVPLYVSAKHKDRKEIEGLFNSYDGFGTLFIDQSGTLIHKFSGTASMPQKYKEQIDIALIKAGENLKVSQLENEYRNGNKSIGFLEQLLLKKKELRLNNTQLLDEYVSLLHTDSLQSLNTLQFIASLSPLLESKADVVLRKNKALYNKAFNSLPVKERMNISAWVLENSLQKAIIEKDEAYALRVITFFRATNAPNQFMEEKIYYKRLLDFYDRVDDVAKYLLTAVHYYDKYVMTVDVDSITRTDEAVRGKLLSTSKKDTIRTEKGLTIKSTVSFSPSAQRYTWDLKEGAWKFYNRTSDPVLLAKATEWIKRANEFFETPESLDVYARLLYKQDQKELAIITAQQAIELKKKQNYSVKDNQETLALMQQGLPLND